MHFFVTKRFYAHFFCREHGLRVFSRKWFPHFVRKVFARWKLPSGKFRLFGPLLFGLWCTSLVFCAPLWSLVHLFGLWWTSLVFGATLWSFVHFSGLWCTSLGLGATLSLHFSISSCESDYWSKTYKGNVKYYIFGYFQERKSLVSFKTYLPHANARKMV